MTETVATDTRQVILDAALTCFRTGGVRTSTMADVARTAGVSRSTVYEYFADKRTIVDAASEHASTLFYRQMAQAMDRGGPLQDRLARAAVTVTRARRFLDPGRLSDTGEVDLLLHRNAAELLRDCGTFLAPYLAAAKLTGEVRRSLDVEAAAEWFARMLFSLFTTPSTLLDTDDADAVHGFVHAHVVHGYLTSPN